MLALLLLEEKGIVLPTASLTVSTTYIFFPSVKKSESSQRKTPQTITDHGRDCLASTFLTHQVTTVSFNTFQSPYIILFKSLV